MNGDTCTRTKGADKYCKPVASAAAGKSCQTDADCPTGQACNFVAGTTSVCAPKAAAAKTCPKGQVMVKSGECWQGCKTDADCPTDQCCRSDPNAPSMICMGKC